MMRRTLSAMLLALALIATSCGLDADESPRLIDAQDLPADLRPGQLPTPTPVAEETQSMGRNQVHMIQGNRLVTVERTIADTPDQLMEILLLNTFPAEAAAEIFTAIPRGTRVQGIAQDPALDLAVVDLAPGSLDSRRSDQQLAFAQIVYTLTSLPSIESVQFVQSDPQNLSAEAVPLAVQTDSRTTLQGERVSRVDFAAFAPAQATPVFDPELEVDIAETNPPFTVWLLDQENQLEPIDRVSTSAELSDLAVLESLLGGALLDERNRLLRSAIPPDAEALDLTVTAFPGPVVQDDGTVESVNIAQVDLVSGSLSSNTDELYFAVAQIVFTLTESAEIDQVVFSIDGTPFGMPNDTDAAGYSLPFDPSLPRGLQRSDFPSALSGTTPPTLPAVTVLDQIIVLPDPLGDAVDGEGDGDLDGEGGGETEGTESGTTAPEPTPTPGS